MGELEYNRKLRDARLVASKVEAVVETTVEATKVRRVANQLLVGAQPIAALIEVVKAGLPSAVPSRAMIGVTTATADKCEIRRTTNKDG